MASVVSTTTLWNVSTGLPSTEIPVQVTFRYFGICVAAFAIVVGGIGNLLTILAFISNRKLRTTFNVFIVNLSLVDFITATLMLPFNLAGYVQMKWPFGKESFSARVQAYSYFCCGYTSVVFLVAITVNRFIGVVKPAQYNELFSRSRMIFTIVVCWTLAPITLFPFFIGTDPLCKPSPALTGYNTKQFLSTFVCLPQNSWQIYMQVIRVLYQFLPLGIMIALYSFIFYTLKRKQSKLIKTMTRGRIAPSVQASMSVAGSQIQSSISDESRRTLRDTRRASSTKKLMIRKMSSQSVLQTKKRNKNENRMLVISIAICVVFMITFLPSVLVNLTASTWEENGVKKYRDVRWDMIASNLTWFNSSVNPIIYVILNRRFRKEYIRLVRMMCGQVKGSFVRDSSTTTMKEKPKGQQNSSVTDKLGTNLIKKEESSPGHSSRQC